MVFHPINEWVRGNGFTIYIKYLIFISNIRRSYAISLLWSERPDLRSTLFRLLDDEALILYYEKAIWHTFPGESYGLQSSMGVVMSGSMNHVFLFLVLMGTLGFLVGHIISVSCSITSRSSRVRDPSCSRQASAWLWYNPVRFSMSCGVTIVDLSELHRNLSTIFLELGP